MTSTHTLRIAAWYARTRWLTAFRSRAQLERYQVRQIERQLRFLRRRSPWFAALDGRRLSDLPIMDKNSMMRHFNELVTVPVDRDEALRLAIESERSRSFDAELAGCSIGLSTGTSGHRGLFLASAKERAQWAGTVLAKTVPSLSGQRIALFLRAGNQLYDTVASKRVQFEFFDTLRPVPEHLERLTALKPAILVGPPSVLRNLAEQLPERDRISPAKVYSVAEVLNPLDESLLKVGFGVDVIHQIYQCTEGFLGCTCSFGTLHLNEDLVHVEREYLDERRFIPVITDFLRSTQPIIRYRMGDVLVLRDSPCPCGSPMTALSQIDGREDDVLSFLDADGRPVPVYADLVSRAVAFAEGVSQYRVVQTGPVNLRLELAPATPSVATAVTRELNRLLKLQGISGVSIDTGEFHSDPGRKLRRVERACT